MRKLLNRLLSPLGYELRRIDRFQQLLDRLLRLPRGVRFVQVGANDGVRFDTLYSVVTTHRCAGLVIEPLPDVFARLRANYSDYPFVTAVNKAVHASAASMSLYRVATARLHELPAWAAGIASFDSKHLLKHGISEHYIDSDLVDCMPLMELLDKERFLDANLLQVDVEGYDAEVIRMIDFSRFKPQLIKYEHKNLSPTDSETAESLLKMQGYRVDCLGEDTVAWLDEHLGVVA